MDIEKLRYPIGRFEYGKTYSYEETKKIICEIKKLPVKLEKIALSFSDDQFEKTYRPGAWTVKRLINHLSDVYINAYMRTKWLLTEDNPTIKTYDENAWALLPDSNDFVNTSVNILLISCLIQRWVVLLEAVPKKDFKRTLYHPEYKISICLDELVAMYVWHGNHHLAHLEIIKANSDEFK